MRPLDPTNRFKKDFQRRIAGTAVEAEFAALLELLAGFDPLPAQFDDHPLRGAWQGCRDCHLRGDMVVIYRRTPTRIVLYRVGTHRDLFGR